MALIQAPSIYEGWDTSSRDFARLNSSHKLRVLEKQIALQLPNIWVAKVYTLVNRSSDDAAKKCTAYIRWLDRYGGVRAADMQESDIRLMAESYAKQAQGRGFVRLWQYPAVQASGGYTFAAGGLLLVFAELLEFVERRGCVFGYPVSAKDGYMRGLAKRLECQSWWRRQLRRMVARRYEGGCFELGLTGAKNGAWYCSDRAVIRRKQQNAANAAMMQARSLQSETGQTMTLADIAARTVANKSIRRGELMTRIKGCEAFAMSQGLVGLFTTNTLPSRFHSQYRNGGRNLKYDGSLPSHGQAWHCKTWAQFRARMDRLDIQLMGFRVVEPHHDGCPHWHMLLWCKPEHVERVKSEMQSYWLREDGNESGARENRVNIKDMLHGMASGYIAKYIAKNIDDEHVDGHFDIVNGRQETFEGSKHIGLEDVKPSMRVEAWAACWSIRQFQAIGQPSVTVWRELRRVDKSAAAGGSDSLIEAWLSVHRDGDKLADWHGYMKAQGGAMIKRKDYRLCVHTIDKDKQGRYGAVRTAWACGVIDRTVSVGGVPTKRIQWGASGFALQRVAMPWTRLNNCTQLTQAKVDAITQRQYETELWCREDRPRALDRWGKPYERPPLGRNEKEFEHQNSAI